MKKTKTKPKTKTKSIRIPKPVPVPPPAPPNRVPPRPHAQNNEIPLALLKLVQSQLKIARRLVDPSVFYSEGALDNMRYAMANVTSAIQFLQSSLVGRLVAKEEGLD